MPPGTAGRSRDLRCAPAIVEQLETWAKADAVDGSFPLMAAFADDACIGASATVSFDVTVPGGGTYTFPRSATS